MKNKISTILVSSCKTHTFSFTLSHIHTPTHSLICGIDTCQLPFLSENGGNNDDKFINTYMLILNYQSQNQILNIFK